MMTCAEKHPQPFIDGDDLIYVMYCGALNGEIVLAHIKPRAWEVRSSVADLFAGSGALGLEALSRGAALEIFVENNAAAIAAIKLNADKLGAAGRIQVLGGSALALGRFEPFDLILADPPYSSGSGSAAVRAVVDAGWLAPGGWLSVETARGETVDPLNLIVEATRNVGRAYLTLLRRP